MGWPMRRWFNPFMSWRRCAFVPLRWVKSLGYTCWWYSLCNFQYWSNCTNTCSYNLGCWIYTSNFFYIFLLCLTDITTTIKCSLFFNVWLYQVREVFRLHMLVVLVV
jgi:hypothetical protein